MTGRLPAHLRIGTEPVAAAERTITGDRWRISVLDAGLVRLEWSPSGSFEDRASQLAIDRRSTGRPVTGSAAGAGDELDIRVDETERQIEVLTERLHLTYDRGPFTPQGLSVQARGGISSYHSVWRFGSPPEGNLGGTARTLDQVDGRLPLDDGILSRHGIAVLDDSSTVLLTDDGWLAPREPGSIDLYVFCYGRDYRTALRAFHRLTGSVPIVPRFALGNWWSRYHRYTDEEYLGLMDRFAADGIPFSVAVLDMDWHPVDIDPRYGSGWTGYSWNRDFFPDPTAFLAQLHERGLKVTLNVHPADGIRAHEDCYHAVARALGRDPDTELPVVFDPTDPEFLRVYLDLVHHPLEEEGVDFWWLDWQSGPHSRMPGLDPLWLLNHLHVLDAGRPGGPIASRPMTLSRYAGPGSHRYPVGFSGDTVVSWASLAFQSEFTATAANVGFGWWSHDVGGHMFGGKDDELATRWVQLGVFSPILRLHSTQDPFNSKEPWRFGEVARRVMTRFLRLRHRLVPFIASAAYHAHLDARSLVEPMYHEHPWEDDAYRVPNQVRFGGSLVVAPVVVPRDPSTLRAASTVWLPHGDWIDLFTGTAYRGGRTIEMHRDIDSVPVLAPAGSIVPLAAGETLGNDTSPPTALDVWVIAGADAAFTLAEDRDDDAWAFTDITYSEGDGRVGIAPVRGDAGAVPERRAIDLVLVGFASIDTVRVGDAEVAVGPGPIPGSRRVPLGEVVTAAGVEAMLGGDRSLTSSDVGDALFRLVDEAQVAFGLKSLIWSAVDGRPPADAALAVIGLDAPRALVAAVLELLLARP
jgi:hypothetical protein